ncbi:MAG TPA: hypothetical protein VKG43_07735 [Acidimicrobiales bacterium]|nr:hypothetical protein [Acidimicrobiales bacterium]
MGYPAVIKIVVRSLRSFAPGNAERESVEVVNLGHGRRAVGMCFADNIEVRVTGDANAPPRSHRCHVQILRSGAVVSEAHGIPAVGVGRVAKALHECAREEGLRVTPDEIIATFAENVLLHQTPGLDTVRTVAEDPHGEAWLEVVDHAYLLGYDLEGPDGNGRQLLWQAFSEYQDRVRTEIGLDPSTMSH